MGGTTWRSSTVGRPGTRCSPTSASTRRGRGRRRSSRCSRGSQHDCPSLTSKSKTLVEATRHSRLKWAKSASARNMLMAPQEVRACCDLVSQTDQGSESWIFAPEIWDFLRPEIFLRARSDLAAGKKVTQISKTGDVATSLSVSVYLEFKKRILPHHHNLTLP